MITPQFTYNAEANAYLSEPFTIEHEIIVSIELASRAPVVTLKKEDDGEYANYGETPQRSNRYKINITPKDVQTLMLASPVEVTKCFILD